MAAVDSKDDMSEQLEITVSCKNLVSKDLLSKSDPFVVFKQRNAKGEWAETFRSETIKNNNHPKFAETFTMKYYFEEVQNIQVEVYDRDSDSKKLSKHDFIGQAYLVIAEIVNTAGQTVTTKLLDKSGQPIMNKKKKKHSSVTVACEELKRANEDCTLDFAASGLPKMDRLFGSADPYFKIFRKQDDNWQEVYKSEFIKNTRTPNWKPWKVSSHRLCGSDFTREMRIEVWDWDKNSSNDLIGETEVFIAANLFEIEEGKKFARQLSITGKRQSRGAISINHAEREEHSFLEYLKGGTQISLMIAIDYTGSNGRVTKPTSLHYYNPVNPYQSPNEYMEAIVAVGNVLAPYDTDNRFPVWAFGAVNKQVHQAMGRDSPGLMCEPLNKLGNPHAPEEVQGVAGVLEAYTRSFQHLDLWYPTNFAPFLEKARDIAASPWPKDEQVYNVLLVLTDGAISDMQNTKQRLIDCSGLPLSVIIVGVGEMKDNVVASMDELDGDDGLIRAKGRAAERDFVQFVEFRKQKANVAKATLAELPRQFLEYMKKKHIAPLDPEIRMARQRDMLARSGQSQLFHAPAPMFQPSPMMMQQQFQVPQGQPMAQPQYGTPGGPMTSPGYGAPNMQPQGVGMQNMQQAFGQMNIEPQQQATSFGGIQPARINASASAPPPDSSAPPPGYSP